MHVHFLFLHLRIGGRGNWSSRGCNVTDYNSTTNVITCECTHLTSFACLVVSKTMMYLNFNLNVIHLIFSHPVFLSCHSHTHISCNFTGYLCSSQSQCHCITVLLSTCLRHHNIHRCDTVNSWFTSGRHNLPSI